MLRLTAFVLAGACAGACVLFACSSDDSSPATTPIDFDGSQPPAPKIEAGAACATDNDCVSGLACLYPTTGCEAFKVCATPIPATCPEPQVVCSCLAETTQACAGFATDPIDYSGPCNDSGVAATDGGADAGLDAPADAPADQNTPIDAPADTNEVDAADAATE